MASMPRGAHTDMADGGLRAEAEEADGHSVLLAALVLHLPHWYLLTALGSAHQVGQCLAGCQPGLQEDSTALGAGKWPVC